MRPARYCEVPGCFHVHQAHGRCRKHCQRLKARAKVQHATICACRACLKRRRDAEQEEIAGREHAVLERAS